MDKDETDIWDKLTQRQTLIVERFQEALEEHIEDWMILYGANFTTPVHDMVGWIVDQLTKFDNEVIK